MLKTHVAQAGDRLSVSPHTMLTMFFRLAILLAMFSCVTRAAHADEASHIAKVHEFFKVAKLDQLSAQIMKQAMDQVNSGLMQQMLGVKLTAEQQQQADDLKAKISAVLTNALGWEKLEPEYTKMYAAAFTEQQMDDILAFYKSPTGQAMIEKNPMLLQESSALAQQRMSDVTPEVEKLIKDFMTQPPPKPQQTKPVS
jgi:hypothetical protein